MSVLRKLCVNNWSRLVAMLAPILLAPIPLFWDGGSIGKEAYAAYVILLMSIYWMTECIPLAVTSLIPVALYPLFGIISGERVCSAYLVDSILFLFGGCVIALAFEYSHLHTRIALRVILFVGVRTSQLLLGIMLTTMFLSMWMNNTSTTAMMIPIVCAILEELRREKLDFGLVEICEFELSESQVQPQQSQNTLSPTKSSASLGAVSTASRLALDSRVAEEIRKLRIMFLLGTAYASNLGGTGVITGSATNIIALDLIRKDAEGPHVSPDCKRTLNVSFVDWMIFNVPPMLINTLFCWFYLLAHFQGVPRSLRFWTKKKSNPAIRERERSIETSVRLAIKKKYEDLGSMGFDQLTVLGLFLIMVALWVLKEPEVIPGWGAYFGKTGNGESFVKEATPTLLMAILFFAIPGKGKYFKELRKGGLHQGMKDTLLTWDFVNTNFPWGIFLLLGGGSAMALGAKESGLNKWLGHQLETSEVLMGCPDGLLLFIILVFIAALTTVVSNTACSAILTPVFLGMAYAKKTHPLYLVLPAASICSYAFILPVSTPPNALVYSSSEDLKLGDMVLPGLISNIVSLIVLFVTTITTSNWALHFSDYQNQCGNMTLLLSGS